jgi:hypothetical protein
MPRWEIEDESKRRDAAHSRGALADPELKHATKGALAIAELVKAFDGHRGRGKQNVTVGQVSVESGGQAVVGNVNLGAKRDEVPDPATSPPNRAASPKKKNLKRFRLRNPDGQQT